MQIIQFVKEYWIQLLFIAGILGSFFMWIKAMIEASRCTLRNDILVIYDRCKEQEKITQYQLESIKYSTNLYFKLKGNSFVKEILKRIETFEIID